MLRLVAGLKSSVGVTTCALVWGHRLQAVVVEADPAGGDVAGWWGWPDSGLSDLATAALRHGRVDAEHLSGCARVGSLGVSVVAAPLLGEAAARCVTAVVDGLPKVATERDLVVDAGRLDPQAATWRLLPHAEAVVLVVAPVAAEVARLRAVLPRLVQVCGDRLRVVVSRAVQGGPPRYAPAEVAGVVGREVAGVVPFDPRTAAVVAGWPGRLPTSLGRWGRWRWPLLGEVARW